MEKTENALTEISCMMGKVVDALTQFKNVVEHGANEDRKERGRKNEPERENPKEEERIEGRMQRRENGKS